MSNRLPPRKVEVAGCSSCPMRVLVSEDDIEAVHECQHPDIPRRDVSGEEGVPEFCPLIRAPLLLVLGK